MTTKMEQLAQTVGQTLKQRGLKLVTAESCTGGGIGYIITDIPGSSAWFDRGFITYSNAAKISMLNVKSDTLRRQGAVSKKTAAEMAEGALQNSEADISLAVTGIAGPGGGTTEKPVGTVWIAYASKQSATQSFVSLFPGNRQDIREHTIYTALERLIKYLN